MSQSQTSQASTTSEQYAVSCLRGGQEARSDDVFAAIMGVTGSGKSSFTQRCSGTQEVAIYAYKQFSGRSVYLIDTPGFDDSDRADTDVLRDIVAWMTDSYKEEVLLSGIIYVHRISDNRVGGSAKRNLLLFRKLCGNDALKKVMLVSTRWDEFPMVEAEKRERQLMGDGHFWADMIEKGSGVRRHFNSAHSARQIVDEIAGPGEKITLTIQDEMMNQKRELDQTSAGQELQGELVANEAKWQAEREELTRELEEARLAHDRQTMEELENVREEYNKKLEKVGRSMRNLQISQQKLHQERIEKLEQRLKQREMVHSEELMSAEEARIQALKEERLDRQRERLRQSEVGRHSEEEERQKGKRKQPREVEAGVRGSSPSIRPARRQTGQARGDQSRVPAIVLHITKNI